MEAVFKKIRVIFNRAPQRVFLGLFIVSLIVAILALRANNEHMIKLRQAVYSADQKGSGVDEALNSLRTYVYRHMNTNLASGGNAIKPPIQLKYTYERLQTVQVEKLKDINSKLYTDAQNYCQSLNSTDFSGHNRVPCVQDYVSSHGAALDPIPAGLYQFDFLSPAWSPDLSGWSLIASAILFFSLIVSWLRVGVERRRAARG